MPALFAYLIALSLLLGGGYGALNWLSEPAPGKVATKSPKSAGGYLRPHTFPEASLSAPSGGAASEVHASTASIETLAQETEPSIETVDRAAPRQSPVPALAILKPSVRAEIIPAEEPVPAVGTVEPFAIAAPSPPLTTQAPRPKAQRYRQVSKRMEKPKLQLMTLRTIEFADGRRETKLVPYRGQARALVSTSGG